MEGRLVAAMQTMETSITSKIDGLDRSLKEHVAAEIQKSEKKTDARIDESWEKNTAKFDKMNARISALEQSAAAAETEAARHRLALTQSLRKQNVLFVGNLSKDTTLEELKTLANTVLDGTNKKFEKCELLSKAGESLGQALIHFVKSDAAKTFRDQFRAKGPHNNKQNKPIIVRDDQDQKVREMWRPLVDIERPLKKYIYQMHKKEKKVTRGGDTKDTLLVDGNPAVRLNGHGKLEWIDLDLKTALKNSDFGPADMELDGPAAAAK